MVSKQEMAEMLRTDSGNVGRWARRGLIPAAKIGQTWAFDPEAVLAVTKDWPVTPPYQVVPNRRGRRVGKAAE